MPIILLVVETVGAHHLKQVVPELGHGARVELAAEPGQIRLSLRCLVRADLTRHLRHDLVNSGGMLRGDHTITKRPPGLKQLAAGTPRHIGYLGARRVVRVTNRIRSMHQRLGVSGSDPEPARKPRRRRRRTQPGSQSTLVGLGDQPECQAVRLGPESLTAADRNLQVSITQSPDRGPSRVLNVAAGSVDRAEQRMLMLGRPGLVHHHRHIEHTIEQH